MRQRQPPMLVVWGKYDPSFAVAGATAYQRDVPTARSTSWMRDISRSTRRLTRSPLLCAASWQSRSWPDHSPDFAQIIRYQPGVAEDTNTEVAKHTEFAEKLPRLTSAFSANSVSKKHGGRCRRHARRSDHSGLIRCRIFRQHASRMLQRADLHRCNSIRNRCEICGGRLRLALSAPGDPQPDRAPRVACQRETVQCETGRRRCNNPRHAAPSSADPAAVSPARCSVIHKVHAPACARSSKLPCAPCRPGTA